MGPGPKDREEGWRARYAEFGKPQTERVLQHASLAQVAPTEFHDSGLVVVAIAAAPDPKPYELLDDKEGE